VTWVKICGLTREADVATAVDAGADALGFVLAGRSARCIPVQRAAALMTGVPALRILVTEDEEPEELLEAASLTGADGVQPHGQHRVAAAAAAAEAGFLVLRPVAVGSTGPEDDLAALPTTEIPLLDRARPGGSGGSGEVFDWDLIAATERRFVLAGGLGPGNVASAVTRVRPWGVDASSRLESAPGVKDPGKVAAFVARAKGG